MEHATVMVRVEQLGKQVISPAAAHSAFNLHFKTHCSRQAMAVIGASGSASQPCSDYWPFQDVTTAARPAPETKRLKASVVVGLSMTKSVHVDRQA